MTKLRTLLRFNWFFWFILCLFGVRILWQIEKPFPKEQKQVTLTGVIRNKKKGTSTTQFWVHDTIIFAREEFQLGDTIQCTGTIAPPKSSHNFYLFDYQKYLASQNIFYQMNGSCHKIEKKRSFFYEIKNQLITYFQKRKSRRYLFAFLLGDTSELTDDVYESYQINGISHLFAVSGMHMYFFFFICSLIFRKRKIVGTVLSLFYLCLVDFTPSMIRACLFPIFVSLFPQKNFPKWKMFLLFTGCVLTIQPYFLYHHGFLFSFIISFFLLYQESFFSSLPKRTKKFAFAIFISVVIIPLQIRNSFSLNLFTPVYNLFVIPFVSMILFPGAFLVALFPILDGFYDQIMTIFEQTSLWFSHRAWMVYFPYLSVAGVILYYVFFLLVMHKLKKKEYKYIVVLFLFLIIHKMIPYTTSNMEIVMLDVGQGDSTLIIYPHHKLTILVDTGGNMSVDMAKTIIIPTLRAYGISSLDALILSHGDYDHAGGALSLLEQFPVHQVFLNSGSNNALEEQLLHYLDSSKIAYKQVSEATWKIKGETLYFLNRRWEQNENQDSLVLFLPFRSYFFLMMGDSDQEVEEELLSRYALEADILKVGHHGSRTSSSLSFVEEVSPHICLISAGSGNRYGHPHTETLQNLKNCDTYLTSIVGAIRITIGSSMHVTTAR